MIKRLNLYSKYLILLMVLGICNACTSSEEEQTQKYQSLYQSLKDNQSKFIFKVNGKEFYQTESIFSGHLEILEKSFTISYFDQFDSNVMIHFGGYKWYGDNPVKIPIKLLSSTTSPVMFGRIKDKENRLGEGYLMSDGFITFKALSKGKIIIEIEGKAKKYPEVYPESPEFKVEALLVCKNPKVDFLNIDEKAAFFGQ